MSVEPVRVVIRGLGVEPEVGDANAKARKDDARDHLVVLMDPLGPDVAVADQDRHAEDERIDGFATLITPRSGAGRSSGGKRCIRYSSTPACAGVRCYQNNVPSPVTGWTMPS